MENINGGQEIKSLPGYAVDTEGHVYSRRPINGKGCLAKEWRAVKPLLCSNGRYLQIGAFKKKYLVHRLVAEEFIGRCPSGQEVSHKNGNSHDNRLCNLEYATHELNEKQKIGHGTSSASERNGMAKLSAIDVINIRKAILERRETATSLAKRYGVSDSTISLIRHGKRW